MTIWQKVPVSPRAFQVPDSPALFSPQAIIQMTASVSHPWSWSSPATGSRVSGQYVVPFSLGSQTYFHLQYFPFKLSPV